MSRAARCYRDRLREFGKSLSEDTRLQNCGQLIRKDRVGTSGEILYVPRTCKRWQLCPVCGHFAANDRCEDLGKILLSWTSQGGFVAILTLTVGHGLTDELSVLLGHLEAGWNTMTRSSCWRTAQRRFGRRGHVRAMEIDHYYDTGFHPHFHTVMLFNDSLDDDRFHELKVGLTTAFIRGVREAGGQALQAGQDFRWMIPGGERGLASYCSKATRILRSGRKRSHMAILAELEATGEGVGLWQECSAALAVGKGRPKRRWYSPSPGIRDLRVNRS